MPTANRNQRKDADVRLSVIVEQAMTVEVFVVPEVQRGTGKSSVAIVVVGEYPGRSGFGRTLR